MFLSVIPAMKMPQGHDFFDYKLTDGTAHAGDLILVPFRHRLMPALVAKLSPDSPYADKAIAIENPKKILKLPEAVPDFCLAAAQELFVSPATLLNAWMRTVPKRIAPHDETHVPARSGRRPKDAKDNEHRYLVNRYTGPDGMIETAISEQANGRLLIVTPWLSRVEYLQRKLGCNGLHAQLADGAAWKAWTGFLEKPNGILVTTRMGAWLSVFSDVVILDEPENDDHKQDELTPRYDARRLVSLAAEFNPSLRTIWIGTTPPLWDKQAPAPEIKTDLIVETLSPNSRSNIESLTAQTMNFLSEALEENRPVRILHPILGTRGRVRCADCGWTMECCVCGFGMNNFAQEAQCRRCNHKEKMPYECPQCGGNDLAKSVIGSDLLQKKLLQAYPGKDIKVLGLTDWQTQSLPGKSLAIISNLNSLAGQTEDVRRKERLIISFRRVAAQALLTDSELIAQGPENLSADCRNWLTPEGLKRMWDKEAADRQDFGFPPARIMAKLIAIQEMENSDQTTAILGKELGENGWQVRGPYKVENRPNSREPRVIYHLLPPPEMNKKEAILALTPLSHLGILDLDPIAFFS